MTARSVRACLGYEANPGVSLIVNRSRVPLRPSIRDVGDRPVAEFQEVWYTYGMQKTTVYLPDELRRNLARAARLAKTSEASLIREAVQARVDKLISRPPKLPLFHSKQSRLAERVDSALKGFGEE